MTDKRLRIDKWLWHARVAKSRTIAAQLCAEGQVEIGDAPATRPSHSVKLGDRITVSHAGWRRCLRILDLGSRRGPASEARLLYAEDSAPERLSNTPSDWQPLITLED